jgi:hypothetical protein
MHDACARAINHYVINEVSRPQNCIDTLNLCLNLLPIGFVFLSVVLKITINIMLM